MVISKLFKSILILVLILVSNSCVNNNKQSKTRLIAVSCREDYNAKAYYLIKGDTVSSISFHISSTKMEPMIYVLAPQILYIVNRLLKS